MTMPGDERAAKGELQEAIVLANRVLDRPHGDPDDDLAVLSRQLLRCLERASGWRDIASAPKDGTKFWGNDDEDAIAMFWHEGFGEFVSSYRRMTMAPGYTVDDKPFQDHSPVIHHPTMWMPRILPLPPTNGDTNEG